MSWQSIEDICRKCEAEGIEFWRAVQLEDCDERGVEEEASWEQMKAMWKAMQESVEGYDSELVSRSGLVGGEGGLMEAYRREGSPLCGDYVAEVMTVALKMGCNNACMKRIVAAPTAGACGVLPAVLIPYYKEHKAGEEKILEAMYVAAGVGQVIANRAFLAGAAGGCQAEIGSGSAMAAAAVCHLRGGTPARLGHAAAMALKNLMGLVCDPVAGLVEVPCVKRNVAGAVNALTAADMALAGIESRIPVDEVIDALRDVGEKMHVSLKETGSGGIAASPLGRALAKRILGR